MSFAVNPGPSRSRSVGHGLTLSHLVPSCLLQVYWDNGAQIISPHDKGIAQAIEENLEPWPQAWEDSIINDSPLLHDPSASINKDYFEDLKKYCFHR